MLKFGRATNGLFIWAAVAIRLVRDTRRPYKKICVLASNESRLTLDDLYGEALSAAEISWQDSEERELFAMLFSLILPNRGSLTIDLFDLLLPFEGDSSDTFLFCLQSLFSCGRFKSIQIHHKTFADYLQSPTRSPSEPWFIDAPQRNSFLVHQCFSAMEELHFDMCVAGTGSGSGEVTIGDIQPHIIYASLYWAEHLKESEFSRGVLDRLRFFLSERLLYWFEAINLLQKFTRVIYQDLSSAIEWVSVSSVP